MAKATPATVGSESTTRTHAGIDKVSTSALTPEATAELHGPGMGNIARKVREPSDSPSLDLLADYVQLGLVTSPELFAGYQQARADRRDRQFISELRRRSPKAADLLNAWINGRRPVATTLVPRLIRAVEGSGRSV